MRVPPVGEVEECVFTWHGFMIINKCFGVRGIPKGSD